MYPLGPNNVRLTGTSVSVLQEEKSILTRRNNRPRTASSPMKVRSPHHVTLKRILAALNEIKSRCHHCKTMCLSNHTTGLGFAQISSSAHQLQLRHGHVPRCGSLVGFDRIFLVMLLPESGGENSPHCAMCFDRPRFSDPSKQVIHSWTLAGRIQVLCTGHRESLVAAWYHFRTARVHTDIKCQERKVYSIRD